MDVTIDGGPVAPGPKGEGWLPMALDFGPLLIWFLSYRVARWHFGAADNVQNTIVSTAAFMIAIVAAVLISKWKLGRVSPMLWLSALLVVFFGGLTIYLKDQRFIQTKPTIIYAFFALMLIGGWLRGKPLLRYLLQSAYNGLDDIGWLKLSRNWGLFFVGLAFANEVMRTFLSFDTWLTIKVWGVTVATFLFGAANLPMMMRHGLSLGLEETEKKS
ncbi:MAG: septation protein IspZ [Sphingobium sp.]|nr:septation protein IspZ [Sphingobium sp.]